MEVFSNWLRKNLVLVIALVIIGGVVKYYFSQQNNIGIIGSPVARYSTEMALDQSSNKVSGIMPPIQSPAAPVQREDRLVIKDTSLSLLVKDVEGVTKEIEGYAKRQGGYLVESNLNKPEETATGTVVIRVPSDKRQETLDEIKKLGVRVVSETVNGEDVTDQYVDTEARLATLLMTKQKLQSLLDRAENVTEILNVQRELDNLQYQIDNLKGQQKYLEQSAKLTRISIYLSTDELALPYAPDEAWRPGVIFKQAVRSLVRTSREAVNLIIWLTVYAPLWMPALIIIWWLKRRIHE